MINVYLFGYVSLLFVAVLGAVFYIFKRYADQGLISRSLNMELLAVKFVPQHSPEMNLQQVKEKIALMEQLYSHLAALDEPFLRRLVLGKPTFALELTIPHVGEELSFYLALPKKFVPAAEKIINGIFPEAQIEPSRDYNIFNPKGVSVGGHVLFSKNKFYPMRTYQKLEGDPLRAVTNVFTKLAHTGEGAALQIVARPAPSHWRSVLKKHAKLINEGKSPNEDGLSKVVHLLSDVFGSGQDSSAKDPVKKLTPSEDETVRALEAKAGDAMFEANLRLIASASTRDRALEILRGLQSSLAQFEDPVLNSFRVNRIEEGNAYKTLIFNFSFRNFNEKKKIVLGSEELASIFHFPNVPLETPKIKGAKSREAPPPADLPQEGLLLGYSYFRGEKRDVRIMEDDRRRHLYIIGQTGTGKSVFLKNMAIQDIEEGRGLCFIDPHGEAVGELLSFIPRHRMQDVIYFNPGDTERPMGMNMLEYDPHFPEHKTLIVNELFGIFEKLFNMSIAGGPIFEQYFRNSAMLVMEDPSSGNTILEVQRVLADKPFRDLKLSRSKNIVVNQFWTQIAEKAGGEASLKDVVPYISSKIDNFISNDIMRPIIAQEKSAFNFREVMDGQKILLVNLSKGRLGDLNSSFIGLILVGKLLMAALSRVDMDPERRKDFYLYIDEFQNVTTDSIATILSEARKYRLDLIITHQFIGQLKEEIKKAVFGNVGSMAAFRIGSDDAEFMTKQFKPIFSEHDLLNLDNANCYLKLLIHGHTSAPFNMRTYPPPKGDPQIAEAAKEISRLKYGRPREEIEEEIFRRFRAI